MKAVTGISFEKDRKTARRYLCVDLEQHGKAITPFLEEVGVLSVNDDVEKAWASALTGSELKRRMYRRIDAWPWKRR